MSQYHTIWLFIDLPNEVLDYLIDDRYTYAAVSLELLDPSGLAYLPRTHAIDLHYSEHLASQPVLLDTEGGFLLVTKPARGPAEIIYQSAPSATNSSIAAQEQLLIPNLTNVTGQARLPALPLPEFDQAFFEALIAASEESLSYEEVLESFSRTPLPFSGLQRPSSGSPRLASPAPGRGFPSSSPRRVEPTPSIEHETPGVLLRQPYGHPVTIPSTLVSNNLELPVISFEEARRLLESGQIVDYYLSPFLQPWAGSPGGTNLMVTLTHRDGTSHLVRARYDPINKQIFPPA